MIKDKKAELATSQLIIILLTAALLVMIILYWPQLKAYTADRLALIIPSLNASKPPAEDVQIIRYDISQDNVQYYDGVSWLDFPMEQNSYIEVENKKIERQKLYINLATNYYYNSELRSEKLIDIDAEIIEDIYQTENLDYLNVYIKGESPYVYFKYEKETNRWLATRNKNAGPWVYINNFVPGRIFAQIVPGPRETLLLQNMKNKDLTTGLRIIKEAQQGKINEQETTSTTSDIKILIRGIQNYENKKGYIEANIIAISFYNKVFAEIELSNEDKAIIRRINSDLNSLEENEDLLKINPIYEKIIPPIIEWRDSILSSPVAITYYDTKEAAEKIEFFCAEKIDNIYLLVRLNNPVDQTEKCQITL